jgi:hypothetical protein
MKIMFDNDLSKISVALEDCLSKIKNSKNVAVQSQRYEYSAKLRDIEKQLIQMADHLAAETYLEPTYPLIAKGNQFYNELFNYCIINNWKKVPEKFLKLFRERKKILNQQIKFNAKTTEFLLAVNKRFEQEEYRIREFYDYVKFVISIKEFNDSIDDLNTGSLFVKCYTKTNDYKVIGGNFNHAVPFYQFVIALNDLINIASVIYDETMPDYDLFKNLPVEFIDNKFCPLFTLLVTRGILAWPDFLNISHVSISLNVNYQLPALNFAN